MEGGRRRPDGPFLKLELASLWVTLACLLLFLDQPPPASGQESCSGLSVCRPTVAASSRSPGAVTSYEVTFVTPVEVRPLSDTITMELDAGIRVPIRITPSEVRVQYRAGEDRSHGTAGDVSIIDRDDSRRPTTVNITPDIRRDDSRVSIPAGAEVTVSISRDAGISNPTEGGSYDWKVGTGNGDNLVNANHPEGEVRQAFRRASIDMLDSGLLVDREVSLSRQEISRGQSVTVTARGYKDGRILTVWRDANINGQLDAEERVLCEATVASSDIGRCDFPVSSPPFTAAFGECLNGSPLNCNLINATDGDGGSSILVGHGTTQIFDTDQVLELVGRIQVDFVQGPGGEISMTLIDFPEGVLTAVDIGGVPVDIEPQTVEASRQSLLRVPVPNEVRLGRQYLTVVLVRADNGELYSNETVVDISEPHTVVRVYPETVLANQRIALSGLNFSKVGENAITEVRLDGLVVDPSRINGGEGSIKVSGDGKWAGFVTLPIQEPAVVPGAHVLQVKDSQGRRGSVEVSVPPREVSVTPVWGRPGSIVTVSGRGFPSRNVLGSSVQLRITYSSSDWVTVTSAEPDVHGNFSQEVRVPLKTRAPSSNLVRVEFVADNGVSIFTSTHHEVPAASVELSPAAGPPGSAITLKASGFRSYMPVGTVMFAETDVSPGNGAVTDAHGEFSVSFIAPGVETGQQTVMVSVAGIVASATFEVTLPGTVPGSSPPIYTALENLGDRLVRVFHFSNALKEWTFYDPKLEENSTLEFMLAGETYLVQVSETTHITLSGKHRTLSCHRGNCWNQIVW